MTPEERARELISSWWGDKKGFEGYEAQIAQALREHGNERLEEAAKIVEVSVCENFLGAQHALKGAEYRTSEKYQEMGDEEAALTRKIRALKDTDT